MLKEENIEKKKEVPTGLFKMLKVFNIHDLFPILKMAIAFLPGKIIKMFYRDIWVITELAYNARDNGYWLFKYIKLNKPSCKVYYVIDKHCSDYKNVAELGDVIQFNSMKHCILFWACNKYASTYLFDGVPFRRISVALIMLNLHGFSFVFLNHGMARGHSSLVDGKQTNYDAVIAASEKEKEIIVNLNNQEPDKVYATGFCRFDNLNDELLDRKLILIMPTWRENLQIQVNRELDEKEEIISHFEQSTYYKTYMDLLNNDKFIELIENNDLKVVFYLHRLAQNYHEKFYSKSRNIVIAKQDDYLVQDLLKQAMLLITDYSSVYFDFCYMKKPMVYFQFDKEEFENMQYSESKYYTYEENGFGPITTDVADLIEEIKVLYKQNFKLDNLYEKRINAYFGNFDKNRCEKVFNVINRL